ncbi:uncharacterized protein [Linepithema humile]|uniref:uncharacterized protein n=1 Tax=Linepithema humile TaxID=83485 RepID=UPI00351DB19A
MWPILCSDSESRDVHMIGVYYGEGKPDNSNSFLEMYTDEAVNLVTNGIEYNGIQYEVRIHALICDVPAKAFILNVKYHSGYNSCTKCDIVGTRIEGVTCFPSERSTNLRTDDSFKNFMYSGKGNYQVDETILNRIPFLGLVSNVPLDYMHMVCLGVMRKLLLLWLHGPLGIKLSVNQSNIISDALIEFRKSVPSDFARLPRSLKFLKLWKAIEFRQFLLYTGPVVLKDVLREDTYANFLTLHVAITILVSPIYSQNSQYVDYAEQLLNHVVASFEIIYGRRCVSHNVHNLTHLAQDVRKYGALDNFSAFRFENYILCIKSMIRKSEKPLQQISRRLIEYQNALQTRSSNNGSTLQKIHIDGPITNDTQIDTQYKILHKDKLFFNCNNNGRDNCLMLSNGILVEALNFAMSGDTTFVIGKRLISTDDLFYEPCTFSTFSIHIVKKNNDVKAWKCDAITAKLCRIPYNDNTFCIFPVCHTYNLAALNL